MKGWTSWEDLGASAECVECQLSDDKFVDLPLYQEIPPDEPGGNAVPVVYVFGLGVPDRFANKTLASVGLRKRFNLNAVAVETTLSGQKRLSLDVCAHNSVMPPPGFGLTLWVGVQGGIESLRHICEFLGELPQALRGRWLPLRSFQVGRIPQWVGRNLIENRIRAEHGVNVLGISSAAPSNGTGGRVQMFPEPLRTLQADDALLVLRPDEEKLEALAAKSAASPGQAMQPAAFPTAYLTNNQVQHAERLLQPDPAPCPDMVTKARYVKENVQVQSEKRRLQAEVHMLQKQLTQVEGDHQVVAAASAAAAAAAMQAVNPWFGLMPGAMGTPFAPAPWAFAGMPLVPYGWPQPFPQTGAVASGQPLEQAGASPNGRRRGGGVPLTAVTIGPAAAAAANAAGFRRANGGGAAASSTPKGGARAGSGSPSRRRGSSGARSPSVVESSPLSALLAAVEQSTAEGPRREAASSACERLKAIDVLAGRQELVCAALARASEDPTRKAAIRAEALERVRELSKAETGCVLIKLLLSNTQAVCWDELRASDPTEMKIAQIFPGETYYTPVAGADSVSMQVVGLPVTSRLDGCSVYELNLRGVYHFSAVALEAGGAVDVRVQRLSSGATLWVGFEFDTKQSQAIQSIKEFLGYLPETLPVRQLALANFCVDDRPVWIGKDLLHNRIRNDYEVSVLGLYPALTQSLNDIVWFPKPDQVLRSGDRLLVLHHDLQRLVAGPTAAGGGGGAAREEDNFVSRLVAALCDLPSGGASGAASTRPSDATITAVELAKDRHGCHVVQEALRRAPAAMKAAMARRLVERPQSLLNEVVKSQHGIHVVRECLFQALSGGFEPSSACNEVAQTFLELVEAEAGVTAGASASSSGATAAAGPLPSRFLGTPGSMLDKKKFSYRLVLWIIEYFSQRDPARIDVLLGSFARNTRQLIEDHNGSIVLSSVLEFAEAHRETVFVVILESIDTQPIPKHWYPSFLIDKLIINRRILDSIVDGRTRLLQALLKNGNLQRIHSHRSGGYTARRVYEDLANEEEKKALVAACPALSRPAESDDATGDGSGAGARRRAGDKKPDFSFNGSLLGGGTGASR